MGLIIYHKGGRKMKKNILIVGGGPEITICYDLINNSTEYNFFSVSEIPTMYPELFVETIETSFRNFGKTIEQIKELNILLMLLLVGMKL